MLNTNIVPSGTPIPVIDSSTEKTSVQDRIKMAENFFKFFFQHVQSYDNNSCYFYLWMQTPDKKSKITKSYPILSPNKNNVRDYDLTFYAHKAIQFNDEGYNVYFSVNVTDKFIGEHNRATKNDITSQLAIVADIDCKNDKFHSSANLPADLKTARSFLPFTPSILVFSGAGLHAYNLLKNPIHFSNGAERDAAQERNRNYLEMIRAKAEGFKIDSVDALPWIMRVPGTYNLKNGRENAPLCRVIETNNSYTLKELDKLIIPRPKPQPKSQKIIVPSINISNEPTEQERARAMLEKLPAEDISRDDWVHVGMILKNNGNAMQDWERWSEKDSARFKDGECNYLWKGFNRAGLTIATLYMLATTQGTYSEKDFRREWYKTHGKTAAEDFDEIKFSAEEIAKAEKEKIERLKIDLQEVNIKINEFESEKNSAIKKLQSVISFDRASVFKSEILNAAAYAKLYDGKTFIDFKFAIKNQTSKQKTTPFLKDWETTIKDFSSELEKHYTELLSQKNIIQAKIDSAKFLADNEILKNYVIPEGYSVSMDAGIQKVNGEKLITVCRRPVAIRSQTEKFENGISKIILSYQNSAGKWIKLPAMEADNIFNAKKLADLHKYKNFPVTSQNASLLVDYLDAFQIANETKIPFALTVNRCGWNDKLDDKEIFIDPRRDCTITDEDGQKTNVTVDDNYLAKFLKSKGTLEEWTKAYELVKKAPVARAVVAASIASPILNVIGERNFVLYTHGKTHSGKTTAMLLGASAVGNAEMVVTFDGTQKGLLGIAADINDYPFFVDEKQSADRKLKSDFQSFIYSDANGKERVTLTRNREVRDIKEWRHITLATGETPLIEDNATGGAFTRLLQIPSPKTLLDADSSKFIRNTIKNNYGIIFPLVIDKILNNKERLKNKFEELAESYQREHPNILGEYCRYVAVITLADYILNNILGITDFEDSDNNSKKLFELIQTLDEISDAQREKDFLLGFIAAKAAQFESSSFFDIYHGEVLGRFDRDFVYITVRALKKACYDDGFSYNKLVTDLVEEKFFLLNSVESGRTTSQPLFQKKINGINTRCYKIPRVFISAISDDDTE